MEITQPIFNKIQEVRALSQKTNDYYLICDQEIDVSQKTNDYYLLCDQEIDIFIVAFDSHDIFHKHVNHNSQYNKLNHLAYIYKGQYYPLT
jgi:hypothetical protein